MSLAEFFSPIDMSRYIPVHGYYSTQIGTIISSYHQVFPDLSEKKADIAIFGVLDDRHAVNNEGCALGPDYFRENFYKLHHGDYNVSIVDLGNIKAGKTIKDTYVAVSLIISELIKSGIVPIIIGGGQDITYAQYQAYEKLEQKVDLVVIDSQFDIEEDVGPDGSATSRSYLNKIMTHEPNYLFNFSNIGYQTYFVSKDSLRVINKLYFDAYRLGQFSGMTDQAEPVIRNANMLSFDIGAIRSSDAMANANASPNGFYGEEACRLCRYAGMTDKLSSIGFYEYNPVFDQNGQTGMLLAQMVWYFIDGFYNRKKDFPLHPKSSYLIFRTALKNDAHELVFIKSKKTDRWWMQVPYHNNKSANERYHLVPCRYEDYQTAVEGEMPDLWWRTYQKLV
ncbi:Arginase family enzyme [bacterium A37T11]|nr:Arginase family enzyme [bacterium A37T11]